MATIEDFQELDAGSKKLSQEAKEIFSKIISPILTKNNIEHHLTGSAYYDLMTWKDIDIHSCVEEKGFEVLKKIVVEFMDIPGIWSVWFKNNWKLIDPNVGEQRIYIGLRYCETDNIKDTWEIDCSFPTKEDYVKQLKESEEFKNSLTEENRSVILKSKKLLSTPGGKMPVGMSKKIYDLVNTGMNDPEEIANKLK
jgi:hypothetical protein